MKGKDISVVKRDDKNGEKETTIREEMKPLFRPAKDDTKPLLQDPILRSDPIETEEAVLRLPPFPIIGSKPCLQ